MAEADASRVYTARGPVDGEDWPAVAAALNSRMAERRIGQQELAQLSGVSVSTLRQLQHGAGRRVQNRTLTAISRALDLPEEYFARVLVSSVRPPAGAPAGDGQALLAALLDVQAQLRDLSDRLAGVETLLGAAHPRPGHQV